MISIWLLPIFIACAVASFLLCRIAKALFPRFGSSEYLSGSQSNGSLDSGRTVNAPVLPLVGGPAFILAILLAAISAGYILGFTREQWLLLLLGLSATCCYMVLGFVDDWNKVYRKKGVPRGVKFAGTFLIAATMAVLYFFLLPSGRESYSPYKDFPFLNMLLCSVPSSGSVCPVAHGQTAYFGWLIFLTLMTGLIGSAIPLSVDISDGLDGLTGGLVLSAAAAVGLISTGPGRVTPANIVVVLLALLCAGGVLGYLPWNMPSSWVAGRDTPQRRAKISMGASGALALGGLLALMAIYLRNEQLLLVVGAAFVLEGLSVFISTRLIQRVCGKILRLLQAAIGRKFVPRAAIRLPFLEAPLHLHYDLLGWDRLRLVYGSWSLGACFASWGVLMYFAPQTWQRYLAQALVLMLAVAIWSSGSWTGSFFVGKRSTRQGGDRRLALYYGFPYYVIGLRMYHLTEVSEVNADVVMTPAEELLLWQRMSLSNARALLGLYCYRAGLYAAAQAQWTRVRALHPDIARLLEEVDAHLTMETQETVSTVSDQISLGPSKGAGAQVPDNPPDLDETVRKETPPDEGVNNGSPSVTQ